MRKRWMGSIAALVASFGGAAAQDIPEVTILRTGAVIVADEPPKLPETAPAPAAAKLPDPASAPCVKVLPEPCLVCRAGPRFWGGIDYLNWTVKDAPLNAAIFTQGPFQVPGGVGRGIDVPNGALGAPGTTIVYGASPIDFGSFNGGRVELGGWVNDSRSIGVQARGFLLERGSEHFSATSGPNDNLALYRPFVAAGQVETSSAVSQPPFTLGSVYANASTHLWGIDSDIVLNLRERSQYRFDALVGFRYLDLYETLQHGSVTARPGVRGAAATTTTEVVDAYSGRNQFYGGQVGGRLGYHCGRLELTATAKIALGATHEVQTLVGFTKVNDVVVPGATTLVGASGGVQVRDRFAALPEVGGKISYRLCDHVAASVGYDFLYLSNVIRPGDQVDRVFQSNAAGTVIRPASTTVAGDFFAHGVSVGLGVTY